jgi:hypothetical protein
MSSANKFLIKLAIPVIFLILIIWFVSFAEWKSVRHSDCLDLISTWEHWTEAGRPQGEALSNFMYGRNYVLVNTQVLEIQGVLYQGQFEHRNPRSGPEARLLITTNGILVCVKPDGIVEEIKDLDSAFRVKKAPK